MSLIQKYTSPSFYNPKKIHRNPNPNPKPFDDALIRRLTSLLASLPRSSPSVPLLFLLQSINLLSSTLASASALLSDPNLSKTETDSASLSSHLDASVSLLDSLNLISSRIDRLSRLRLHVTFALHLLSSPSSNACKARDSLAEWGLHLREPAPDFSPSDLLRNGPPRGKISAVRRAIYAVEAVSALVVGLTLAFLDGAGFKASLEKIRVPDEFPWSGVFNGVLTEVSRRIGCFATEIEAVDASVKELTAAVSHDGEMTEKIRSLRKEAERRTEELTEDLDRLGSAVNGLFRAALNSRDAVLQEFRVGAHKCK